jgi:hypothetical protein
MHSIRLGRSRTTSHRVRIALGQPEGNRMNSHPKHPIALLTALVLLASVPRIAAAEQKEPLHKRPSTPPARARSVHALADISELEPNNGPGEAQDVGCGNSLAPASLANVSTVPDTDWVRFTVNAGDLITFETSQSSDNDPYTDTVINLIASDGITSLAVNDDYASGSFFSRITDYQAPYTGVYYGRIRGFDGDEGPYRASVSCVPPPPPPVNDRCEGAIDLPYTVMASINVSGTTRFATNDYDLCPGQPECSASCTGFHSPGKDVVYRIVVAHAGDAIDVTYTLDPASTDASIYIVRDCSNVAGTCVTGIDSDLGSPPERLTYRFSSAGTYYLILDAFTPGGGSYTLQGCIGNCAVTATRHASWARLKSIYR